MYQYDYDEMARHFSAMRVAYLDYRRGGPQPVVEKKLEKYLALSDIFYRKFPNPFESADKNFDVPSEPVPIRASASTLAKKLNDLKKLKKEIEGRIEASSKRSGQEDFSIKLREYLELCEEKIKAVESQLSKIETSGLPI